MDSLYVCDEQQEEKQQGSLVTLHCAAQEQPGKKQLFIGKVRRGLVKHHDTWM